MKKDIVIIGAGGFGREVAWLIEDINKVNHEWNILGFVDDDPNIKDEKIGNYNVLGNLNWLQGQELYVVCAVGNPQIKKNILSKLKKSKNKYPVLIHPSVIYSDTVSFGEGTIVCAGCIITVDIKVNKHVIINVDSTIGHDVVIKDYSTVLPSVNISGNVVINECVSVGTGSAIIQEINIGRNSIIGAGTVVVKNVRENVVYVGVPGKIIRAI